jgi:hypothetical protein
MPTAQVAVGQDYPAKSTQEYLGCFNDSVPYPRTPNAYYYYDFNNMTIEQCQASCNAKGYRLGGVEYTQECHCENVLSSQAVEQGAMAPAFCNFDCVGTVNHNLGYKEVCGGLQYMNVYNNTDPKLMLVALRTPNGGISYAITPQAPFADNYLGCYNDSSDRTLGGAYMSGNGSLTIEGCHEFCAAQGGSRYHGLEYGSQCYCGNYLNPVASLLNLTSSPTNASACSMRCTGNNPEICGGGNALSMYIDNSFVVP